MITVDTRGHGKTPRGKMCIRDRPMVIYVCKKTDTLWYIAKKFKTSIDSIKQTNLLEDDTLISGQKLLIVK